MQLAVKNILDVSAKKVQLAWRRHVHSKRSVSETVFFEKSPVGVNDDSAQDVSKLLARP